METDEHSIALGYSSVLVGEITYQTLTTNRNCHYNDTNDARLCGRSLATDILLQRMAKGKQALHSPW